MGRKPTKLGYIANDALRRRTFLKRETSLLKKASELSVLCDVPACVLIASPCDPNRVIIWPSPVHARNLIDLVRRDWSSVRGKRALDQDAFLSREVARLKDQLQKVEREIREAEAKVTMMRYLRGEGCADRLEEVGFLVEEKARAVAERIERLNGLLLLVAQVPDEAFINQPELGPNGASG
ncbi:Floral homeotic protein GLOBOSA [Acorus gramineus]|uniref:Floral homeotic protein GLOBOSA n=1 Tax=Acorus gramineus TaxID=55184 RepID=A0AAV9BHW9_ACOGR|nr:Floral homeotic protein GLOBOSA [Acorus gramineus]